MTVMVLKDAAQGIAAVPEEMKAIRYLDCLRSSLAGSVGVSARTIPDKYLDAGMTPQPDCQSRGLAVGQQVDDAVAFQIAQDRAVALAFAPSPVIDVENTDFRHWIGNCLADAARQRRGADRDCHPARQARSGIAAQCQCHGMVQGAKTIGVASPGPGYGIGTFGKGPLAADEVYIAEAADAHQKNKLTSQTENVAEAAPVVAVNPR
ncbi:hypothetical protein N825_32710 [Skermanella stibiiresistens SB22]|uniref:Uncharacterized protein n=1 Tax=Skermanella stibiiresistens SB22 TaxID=1385369 RepID=W9H3D2_9PROT|nr:hypothetical protein N825_32710 [Skermanella stibiiresistens SB22]